jgi:hypothetical protein
MLVFRFATPMVTRPGERPEIVVARCPEDLGKTTTEKTQGKFEMLSRFANITRQNEPVLRELWQLEEGGTICGVAQV